MIILRIPRKANNRDLREFTKSDKKAQAKPVEEAHQITR